MECTHAPRMATSPGRRARPPQSELPDVTIVPRAVFLRQDSKARAVRNPGTAPGGFRTIFESQDCASAAVHATVIAIAFLAIDGAGRNHAAMAIASAPAAPPQTRRLVFLPATRPASGGGGGGNRRPGPLRRAESRRTDAITVRVAPSRAPSTGVDYCGKSGRATRPMRCRPGYRVR